MKKKTKRQILTNKLDKVFSEFIRLRDKFICFTCGKIGYNKTIDCGHYEKRHHLSTRWDEKNCHAQCKQCNIFKGGNYTIFSLKMIEKYGVKFLKKLNKKAHEPVKFSLKDLEDKIEYFKKKLNKLKCHS